MKKKNKKLIILAPSVLVAIAATSFLLMGNSRKAAGEEFVIRKTGLTQELGISGKTKPSREVQLAFEKSGKVAALYADVGDKVKIGQTLTTLENSELLAQVAEADADVKAEEAQLEELRHGVRPEEIQVQETKVASAKIYLETTKNNLFDNLRDAYTKSDDAVRNRVDQFFKDPRSSNPQLTFLVSVPQTENQIESGRLTMENSLDFWEQKLNDSTFENDLKLRLEETLRDLTAIRSFLNVVSSAVNEAELKSDGTAISQTTLDGWKSDVATGRTNLNTAISNLTAADEKLKQAEADLKLAESELNLKKAGTTKEQITVQEAKVKKTQANADYYRSQLAKTIIRSPINGVISKRETETGEIVAANSPVISVISENNFEIEANIPEADIAKIKTGAKTRATLDAYGDEIIFEAVVVRIDPAETVTDGAATYKIKLQFLDNDERIKSGMTANLKIASAEIQNALAVPQSALIFKNGKTFVRALKNGKTKETEIKTGVKSSDGKIEVVRGLEENDIVLTGARK